MTNKSYAFDKIMPMGVPLPPPSQRQKYWCEDCKQGFDDLRQYLNHYEFHKKSLVETTKAYEEKGKETKGFFLNRLLHRVWKSKGVNEMAKEETKEGAQEEQRINEVEMKVDSMSASIDQMERGIQQLTAMVSDMNRPKLKSAPTIDVDLDGDAEDFDDTAMEGAGKKRLRVTVIVPEKKSGEFLKTIQDNKDYAMENIEVVKGK